MIRLQIIAALLLLAGAYQFANSTVHRPVAPPTAGVIHSSTRVEFTNSARLNLSGAAVPPHQIKSLLRVPGRLSYGDYVWDDEGVPNAPLWVFVDLTAQTMSVFRGNHEIAATVFLYGADEKPTPIGRFKVLQMSKDHWSRTYDAPMPYMLRLTEDGVAIHGSDVRRSSATHGCLGVPIEFAKRLFAEAKLGDEIFITRAPRLTSSPA